MARGAGRQSGDEATGVTFATVRESFLGLPGVIEGTSYGTPAFRVRGRFLARLRPDEVPTLVVRTDFETRDLLIALDPDAFFFTDHYRDYPSVLVRLPSVHPNELQTLIEDAWRAQASQRLVAQHESARPPPAAR